MCDGNEYDYLLGYNLNNCSHKSVFVIPAANSTEVREQPILKYYTDELVANGGIVMSFESKWGDLDKQAQAIRSGHDTFTETCFRINTAIEYIRNTISFPDVNIVLTGASRFGFASLHCLAKNKKINAVVALLPVTYWPFLREFKGLEESVIIKKHDLAGMIDKFFPRDVFLLATGVPIIISF